MKVLKERENDLDEFSLLKCSFFFFLQRFFESYIPSLSLRIIGELLLAVVREIGIKSRVVAVVGQAINASTE